VGAAIARRLAPFEEEIALLDTIPGVGRETAEALLADIGTNRRQFPQFPSAAQVASGPAGSGATPIPGAVGTPRVLSSCSAKSGATTSCIKQSAGRDVAGQRDVVHAIPRMA
jgi:hypothetical protein